ncbi:hypothetical protein AURDEDRAFT_172850 [Auricularia subglabra TFB-10046 SS5]|uniref:DUF6533 domain-containing protein n=1 Tax=Auricularia subglabra (strain TFB-10046 / SS5) TaxID=717982 RepID=J0DBM6_AURST|nr:hypothetical protein AURDEDRAFT_172850 [Auricularia subglabra TFB-10046 SS5]
MSLPHGPDLHIIQEVLENLKTAQLSYFLIVATAALYFYDYALTLSAEITLVWRSKWGVGKVLFLLERYMKWPELLVLLYSADCYLMQDHLRTITFFSISEVDPHAAKFSDNNFCLGTAHTKSLSIMWVTVAAFELVIFVMSAMKGLGHLYQRRSSLISSIYRDSMLYFVFLFGFSAANAVVVYTYLHYAIVLGLLILHIRAAAGQGDEFTLPDMATWSSKVA